MSLDKSNLETLRIDRTRPPVPSRHRTWIVVVIIALLLMAGYHFSQSQVISVKTALVRQAASGNQQTVLNASGYVTARRQATVSSKVTGKVVEVLLEEGIKVEAGQVLAKLDDVNTTATLRLYQAQVAAAESALAELKVRLTESEAEWQRISQLATNKISSASEYDHAKADFEAKKAQLTRQEMEVTVARRQVELCQQEIDDLVIRAPFAGVVVSKNAQPGEMISPISAGGGFTRTGIGTVVDMASLEIEVDVNESFIGRVKAGQGVTATLDAYPDWHLPAKVIAIIPTADRQKATVKVRIGFERLDPRILPDMGVKVEFKAEGGAEATPAGMLIPKSALRQKDGKPVVYVLKNGKVEAHPVTVVGTQEQEVTISSGLTAGERAIIEGPDTLEPGVKAREN
jgi:RND family efflux transporter MFP subunit